MDKEIRKYIEALQQQINNPPKPNFPCYHRWDKDTGICCKCGNIYIKNKGE